MAKQKEAKRLCRCGCGKMLSARTERRHRDGQVPPRIAAIQQSQSHISKSGRCTRPIKKTQDSSMDSDNSDTNMPSLMDTRNDTPTFPDVEVTGPEFDEPAVAFPTAVNGSIVNARAAVWAEWRTGRGAVSDDEIEEEEHDSGNECSEDELLGLEDDEVDTQSVDDRIEAEWEKEWADIGV